MNLTALLSFYDEQPEDLERLVASLPRAGVTHLAALDGAYALFPDAKAQSSDEELSALLEACAYNDLPLTLHIPETPWQGNEIEKRTALFDLGYETGADWYLVIDGDEHITKAADLTGLEHSTFDVAEITYIETKADGYLSSERHPRLFRAIQGLHCFGAHYVYRTPDERLLWGSASSQRLEPRHVAHQLEMTHEPRSDTRRAQALAYYNIRDTQGIETGRCQACNERPARHRLNTNIRAEPGQEGQGRYRSDTMDLCRLCLPIFQQHNTGAARAFMLDLDDLNQPVSLGA